MIADFAKAKSCEAKDQEVKVGQHVTAITCGAFARLLVTPFHATHFHVESVSNNRD